MKKKKKKKHALSANGRRDGVPTKVFELKIGAPHSARNSKVSGEGKPGKESPAERLDCGRRATNRVPATWFLTLGWFSKLVY